MSPKVVLDGACHVVKQKFIIAATFGDDDMKSKAARDTKGRLKIGIGAARDTNACRGIAPTNL